MAFSRAIYHDNSRGYIRRNDSSCETAILLQCTIFLIAAIFHTLHYITKQENGSIREYVAPSHISQIFPAIKYCSFSDFILRH